MGNDNNSFCFLFRECSKFTAKDQLQGSLQDLLLQLGLSEAIVSAFCEVFHGNRRRILALKGALGVSAFSYHNLSWRLDVEVQCATLIASICDELNFLILQRIACASSLLSSSFNLCSWQKGICK